MLDFNPTKDTENDVRTSFSSQSVDALLYYLFDANLSAEQKEVVKRTLLGKTRPNTTHRQSNASLVTSDFCARYAQFRAIGLSQRDAASQLDITILRLESLLHGEGLTEKQHEMILNAEACAESSIKLRCLKSIDHAIGEGQWKAAIALLEKKFPKEYGRKLEVNSTSNVRWSSDECEQAATKARDDLERIRAERAEVNGVSAEDLYVASE